MDRKEKSTANQLENLFSPEREMMSLQAAIRLYFRAHVGLLRPRTVMVYSEACDKLMEFIGADRPIAEITEADLSAFRAWLMDERELYADHPNSPTRVGRLSVATVRKHLGHCRTFFKWASQSAEVAQLNHNPMRGVKLPAKPKARPKGVSVATVSALLAEIERTDHSRAGYSAAVGAALTARNLAIVHFLRSTGCRLAGLTGLTLADVTIEADDGFAFVREKGQGQSSERWVIMDEVCVLHWLSWLDHHPLRRPTAPAFCNVIGEVGSALPNRTVYSMLQRVAKRAGVDERFNPHAFRHAAITQWVEMLDVGVASQMAGHSSVTVTIDTYARFDLKRLREAHKRAVSARGE